MSIRSVMPGTLRLSWAVRIGPSHSRQTVTMLVPINNRIAKWPATGELSRDLAARWDRLHRLRVAVLVLLFAVLAVAVT
jgi:hypothetical protein